jgi:Acetyltransferase (GNAT) domain
LGLCGAVFKNAAMLIEATDAHFQGLLDGVAPVGLHIATGGIENDAVLNMLRNLANIVRASFSPAAWLIVDQDIVVGICSVLSVPDTAGEVAIGYGIARSCRGRGLCTKAVGEIVIWAKAHPAIFYIIAETAIDNQSSQNVLSNNKFQKVGTRTDVEDGKLLRWKICVKHDDQGQSNET